MAEPFIGEIKIFAGTFAPVNWEFCEGQYLTITQYPELFALLGTTYGGDGRTNFALPDLRGRLPIHYGTGVGLTTRFIGQRGGQESVELTVDQIPGHNHTVQASTNTATESSPVGSVLGRSTDEATSIYAIPDTGRLAAMPSDMLAVTGKGADHSNIMPFMSLNFIIAMQGVFPPRN